MPAAGVGARDSGIGTLKVLVRASFDASKQRYGSPRIHEDLLEQDERVSRKRVIRLMQEEGLKARVAEALQGHDDERSRPAGRGESAGSAVHGRRRRISAGSATRPSS